MYNFNVNIKIIFEWFIKALRALCYFFENIISLERITNCYIVKTPKQFFSFFYIYKFQFNHMMWLYFPTINFSVSKIGCNFCLSKNRAFLGAPPVRTGTYCNGQVSDSNFGYVQARWPFSRLKLQVRMNIIVQRLRYSTVRTIPVP